MRWQVLVAGALAAGSGLWLVHRSGLALGVDGAWLKQMAATAGASVFMLTTEPTDLLSLATDGYLLHQRRVIAAGQPLALYRRPTSVACARLLGGVNVLKGVVRACGAGECLVETSLGEMRGACCGETDLPVGSTAFVLTRPEVWHLDAYPPEENMVHAGAITLEAYCGSTACFRLVDHGLRVTVLTPTHLGDGYDTGWYAWCLPEDVTVVPA